MEELRTLVLYDIEDDKLRTKISETCKDYGLERIQFSAFAGSLNRNKRDELFLKLSGVLGEKSGRILIQPLCEKDERAARIVVNEEKFHDTSQG